MYPRNTRNLLCLSPNPVTSSPIIAGGQLTLVTAVLVSNHHLWVKYGEISVKLYMRVADKITYYSQWTWPKWVVSYRLWRFSHEFEHPKSTPYYLSLPLILSVIHVNVAGSISAMFPASVFLGEPPIDCYVSTLWEHARVCTESP